ncbi:MAG: TonB-dependent receptor, partial [Sphingobacteriales bacterium]
RKLRYLFVLLFVSVANVALAQNGAISGTVIEKSTNDAAIGAVVEVIQAGAVRGGAVTDENGKYSIKPLNAANDYEVRVRMLGFKEVRLTGVLVAPDRVTYQNFSLENTTNALEDVVVIEYRVPLINKGEPGTSTTLTSDQIEVLPTRQTSEAATLVGGTYQQGRGGAVSIGGARSNGTLYIVDGVQVNGAGGTNFPPNSIDQISVLTSGIPAKYGDATGGVISITTKGPKAKTEGSVGVEKSVDGYGHNLAYFNVGGPLIRRRVDSVTRKSVLGYTLSGQYLYDVDNNPSYYPNYVLKSDVLARLQQNPLVLATTTSGAPVLRYGTEYIRASDLEERKARVNADYKNARLVSKFDYQVADNMNIVFGGNVNLISQKAYSRGLTLFSPGGIPTQNSVTGRGFVRFTQKFGKPTYNDEQEENKKAPLVSNASYSLQADYQIDYFSNEDPKHKRNAFDYGYIGKFDVITNPLYLSGPGIKDDSTGLSMTRLFTYDYPVAVNFTRSELNPVLANYTSQFYNFIGENRPLTLNSIQQGNALRNGDVPPTTYG